MARQIDPHEGMADMACFVISVAARLLNVHPQTLRYYERAGLIAPSRSRGNIRLYSTRDIERAQQIKRLIEDLGRQPGRRRGHHEADRAVARDGARDRGAPGSACAEAARPQRLNRLADPGIL